MVEAPGCFWKCPHLSVCFTPSALNEVTYFGSMDLVLPQHSGAKGCPQRRM